MLMVVPDSAAVVGGRVPCGHGEVRQRGDNRDERRDDVEETLRGRHVPREEGEEARGEDHQGKCHP